MPSSAPPTVHDPVEASVPALSPGRRRALLVSVLIALTAVVASVSGLNVAQGQLAADLGASQSQLLWIINGYTVALAALLLPVGAVGDRWGRKHVLVAGLVLFIAANVAAALAGSVTALLVARIVAGAAAAMIMPVTLSVITSTFAADERDRAIGLWAGFAGAGGILGLWASAVVIDNATWPWVFALPIALAVGSLVGTLAFVPQSKEDHEGRFDLVGSITSALAVGLLVLGIHEGPEVGWTATITVVALVVGVVAAAAFVWWELRADHPLLDVRVFRNRTLSAGSLTLTVVFALMMGLFLVVVQFLQAALGWSAVRASLGLMPMAAIMLPLSAMAPTMAKRVGLRSMFVVGLGLVAGGLALMAAMVSVDGGYLSVLPGLLVLSVGAGLSQTPATAAITQSLPLEKQGVASALNDTVREFGGSLGIALIGSVLSAGYSAGVADVAETLPPEAGEVVREGIGGAAYLASQVGPSAEPVMVVVREAFVDGFANAMWASAALALAAAIFALVAVPARRVATPSEGAVAADPVEQLVLDGPAVATAVD
jgi:EmrB/QacA subfamily drug resistance transporter